MQRESIQAAAVNDNPASPSQSQEASLRRRDMPEHTHIRPRRSSDQGSLELMEEYIRLRAYELFEARGRQHGHDVEDWLEAEAEILGKRSSAMATFPARSQAVKAA